MINKENIYIDRLRQNKERNISIGDLPVFSLKTNRQLKNRFRHYFKNLSEYYGSKNKKYLEWSKEYRYTSEEADVFLRDVFVKEHRC